MSDQDEPDRDEPALGGPLGAPDAEDFDDPGHRWVRDLLADARPTSPVPADVAARLDETLAGLQAERGSALADFGSTSAPDSGSHSVVPLRRRLRPRLTAAAAAVIVLGAGGVAVAQLGGNGSSGSDSASSRSAADSAGAAASPKATGSVSAAEPQALSGSGSAVPRLTTASFAADAAQVMRQVAVLDATSGRTNSFDAASPSAPVPAQTPSDVAPEASTATSLGSTGSLQAPPVTATPPTATKDVRGAAACAGPSASDGVTLQATLDGTPVALVFRAPTATGQRVEAWSCDGSTLLQSAVIPH